MRKTSQQSCLPLLRSSCFAYAEGESLIFRKREIKFLTSMLEKFYFSFSKSFLIL